MPFEIVRNDITQMRVDAIVNTANPAPVVGSGVDLGIHQRAGTGLLEARKKIGAIKVGQAVITPAFDLPAKFVIHTAGPVWQGGGEYEQQWLRKCYDSALELARVNGCSSVAFPLISAGNYGFPKELALQTAVDAFRSFLMKHDMQIYLVVFNKEAFVLSEQLYHSVQSYIDACYVEQRLREEYPEGMRRRTQNVVYRRMQEETLQNGYREEAPEAVQYECRMAEQEPAFTDMVCEASASFEPEYRAAPAPAAPQSAKSAQLSSLEEMLRAADAGFSETLLRMIDQTGRKDAEIYKRANVDRKLFSKIRKNPDYRPSKATALAFALALELDLAATADLIGRAGYALTRSSKFDIIVEYFILHGNYNVFELNEALFAFDQPLIGA